MKKIIAIIVIVLGVISGILFFSAGSELQESGNVLAYEGGKSAADAYFQDVRSHAVACSLFAYAMGTGVIMLAAGLSGVLLSKDGK